LGSTDADDSSSYQESAWSEEVVIAILLHSTSLSCSQPTLSYTSRIH